MKTLKGIAANTAFIFGGLLLLLPLGILSELAAAMRWLMVRLEDGIDALGYAISDKLPEPRQVFSESGWYWFWQVLAVCAFLWCLLSMLALMAAGQPLAMLWQLAMAMAWAVIITRAWEKRHAN